MSHNGGMVEGRRYRFDSTRRLHGQRAFEKVLQAGVRKNAGPLMIQTRPNDLANSRLGLRVSRRTGNAIIRNRIKRMVRESFRLLQHQLPVGYDVVVSAFRHKPLKLEMYQKLLLEAVQASQRQWERKKAANSGAEANLPSQQELGSGPTRETSA